MLFQTNRRGPGASTIKYANLTNGDGLDGSLSWYSDDVLNFRDRDGNPVSAWQCANNPLSYQPGTHIPSAYYDSGEGTEFYPPRGPTSPVPDEKGPIPSIRIELWRKGLEDAQRFFTLQRLLLASPSPPSGAWAALDAVGDVIWDFPVHASPLGEPAAPYSTNTTLLHAVLENVAQWIVKLQEEGGE